MAITFVSASATPAAGNNANATPSTPAGLAQDDVMWYLMSANDLASAVGTFSTPAGWTSQTNNLGTGGRITLFWKKFNTGDTIPATTYTGGGTGDAVLGTVFAFRGVDTAAPIDVQGTVSVSGGVTAVNIGPITGITPTVSDAAVIVLGNKSDDSNNATPVAALTGDSLTWAVAKTALTTLGNDALHTIQYAIISGSPVAITNKTFTVNATSNSVNWQGVMFSIKPAAAGGAVKPRRALLGVGV